MEIFDITVNGSGFDPEYNFNNYALTLVFKDEETEKTVRANLRYYPTENEWDLNPIFYEYTKDEKQMMINQIIKNDNFRSAFETIENHLEG
ncbi:MAG: hypothetical protein P4L59_17540 [Desulfosporosinus sp.]|nr:hypothetical protein [Desulfosporosinus sp.]